MNVAQLIAVAIMGLMVAGCAVHAPVVPPAGLLFTNYSAPISTNFEHTPRGSKVGVSQTTYFRDPFLGTSWAWSDGSVQRAARNGGLTTVNYVDYHFLSILGLIAIVNVRAYGD